MFETDILRANISFGRAWYSGILQSRWIIINFTPVNLGHGFSLKLCSLNKQIPVQKWICCNSVNYQYSTNQNADGFTHMHARTHTRTHTHDRWNDKSWHTMTTGVATEPTSHDRRRSIDSRPSTSKTICHWQLSLCDLYLHNDSVYVRQSDCRRAPIHALSARARTYIHA